MKPTPAVPGWRAISSPTTGPGPVTRLKTPGGQVGVGHALGQRHRAHRGARGGRPDDGVPAGQRGRDQLGRHRVGPVPGADDADHAPRPAGQEHALAGRERVRVLAAQPLGVLGGHPPVLDQLVDLVERLGVQGLALVEGQRVGQRVAPGLDQIADGVHLGRALERRQPRPAVGRRPAAAIAARASSRSPVATVPIVSPVAGLVATDVSPPARGSPISADEHLCGAVCSMLLLPV